MIERRSNWTAGVVLILLGVFFLVAQFVPNLMRWISWPMILIGLGVVFLASAVIFRVGPLTIPGAILTGLGLIFTYQNTTGDWSSWAYIWALIPGFVGVGLYLASFISPETLPSRQHALRLIGISLVLFLIFGGLFNALGGVSVFWPAALILVGGYLLYRAIRR